jgi:hypothetical protein
MANPPKLCCEVDTTEKSLCGQQQACLREVRVYDGVMPANTTKTSAAANKQRVKKQPSRNVKQQDLYPREELLRVKACHFASNERGLITQRRVEDAGITQQAAEKVTLARGPT